MRPFGQVDLKPVLVTLGMSAVSWFGGATWTRYGVAEDMRREQTEQNRRLDSHDAKLERITSAIERQTDAVERIEEALPKKRR